MTVKHFTDANCEQGRHKEKQKYRGCDKPTFVQSQTLGVGVESCCKTSVNCEDKQMESRNNSCNVGKAILNDKSKINKQMLLSISTF